MEKSEKTKIPKKIRKKTILVVDDEYVVVDVLKTFLSEKNYRVVYELDPTNVESVIEKESPDLIFLDNRMYPVTGKELLRKIRIQGNTVPVIMMSAYKTRDGIFEMKQLGAVDYIAKPFDFKKISKLLSRCF
ncbi:MAG: response regulator [Candidatus Aureabacteria bacterium]|nr:response regulator [Candidatus Auribacterota bacterium]